MAATEKLHPPAGAPAAVYERRVAASQRRVWENVLDWEHLPWVHRDSFASIRCEASGPWGWRVCVGIEGLDGPRDAQIELLVDRSQDQYVTRTLAGPGAGNEIWTRIHPEGDQATHVRVAFHLGGVPEDAHEMVGQGFVALYRKLWDEDEAMMIERQRILDQGRLGPPPSGRPPHDLGEADALRRSLPLVVEAHGRGYRIVEAAGELFAHPVVCPHRGGPLGEARIDDGQVVCPWHGYRFELATGREHLGRRCKLVDRPAVAIEDGRARLVFDGGRT